MPSTLVWINPAGADHGKFSTAGNLTPRRLPDWFSFLLASGILLMIGLQAAMPKTIAWVSGGVLPTTFSAPDNWIDVETGIAPLTPPVTGDTLQFLNGNVSLPALGFPNAGEIFALVIDGASEGAAWSQTLDDFCGPNAYAEGVSGWSWSSLQVGEAGRNDDSILLIRDSVVGGTITAYGPVSDDASFPYIANATVTVKSGGSLRCYFNNWGFGQPITIETGGILYMGAVTLLANGGVNLAGTLDISFASSVLDTASPVLCTGNAIILWGSGGGVILGGLNANGKTVTHTDTAAGNELTCDAAGTLNLGGDATGLTVIIAQGAGQTVTLAGSSSIRGFTLNTDGTLAGGGYTLTLGAGAFTSTKGTVSGTLNVNLGSGGITYTAGTYPATFTATLPAGVSTAVLKWDTSENRIGHLVIHGSATTSGRTRVRKLTLGASGVLATNGQLHEIFMSANDAMVAAAGASVTGNGGMLFQVLTGGPYTNTGPIVWSTAGTLTLYGYNSGGMVLNAAGGITCGALDVGGSNGEVLTVNLGAGNLNPSSVVIGSTTGAVTLNLGTGTHTIGTGGIVRSGTTTTGVLTGGSSRVNFAGNINLTGITADLGTSAWFATANNKTITGGASIAASGCDIFANGNTLTVNNMGTATVRCWNNCTPSGTNTNVQFLSGPPDDY